MQKWEAQKLSRVNQEQIFLRFVMNVQLLDSIRHSDLHCYQYKNFNSAYG